MKFKSIGSQFDDRAYRNFSGKKKLLFAIYIVGNFKSVRLYFFTKLTLKVFLGSQNSQCLPQMPLRIVWFALVPVCVCVGV